MRFEWDTAKSAANLAKHGVAFEDARAVFADPFARSRQDRQVLGEERWQTMGYANAQILIVVAHTWRDATEDEVIRIISARRATRQERGEYEQGR